MEKIYRLFEYIFNRETKMQSSSATTCAERNSMDLWPTGPVTYGDAWNMITFIDTIMVLIHLNGRSRDEAV